jgi:protein TonB
MIGPWCRNLIAEIAARAAQSAGRVAPELTGAPGVYNDVFEQSLLLNQDTKRPWNFLASLSAELAVVGLALLIPLLYRDHLPAVHWKDITVGPAPLKPPIPQPATHASGPTSTMLSTAAPRRWNPSENFRSEPASPVDFSADAPPALGPGIGGGGATSNLGTFLPNFVAGLPPPKPPAVLAPQPARPLAVGGDVLMAKLVRKVIPPYPPLARAARISGVVHLMGIIGKDGTIRNLQLISGHPMLARAAIEAVQQWLYKPTLLNGNPVEVIAPIDVSFTLGQ